MKFWPQILKKTSEDVVSGSIPALLSQLVPATLRTLWAAGAAVDGGDDVCRDGQTIAVGTGESCSTEPQKIVMSFHHHDGVKTPAKYGSIVDG
jgi:hypothetical protein